MLSSQFLLKSGRLVSTVLHAHFIILGCISDCEILPKYCVIWHVTNMDHLSLFLTCCHLCQEALGKEKVDVVNKEVNNEPDCAILQAWLRRMLTVITDSAIWVWDYFRSLDIDYLKWVLWVVYPVLISFLLPLVILVFLYASALFLQILPYWKRLRAAYQHDIWDGARKTIAAAWAGQAYIFHGNLLVWYSSCLILLCSLAPQVMYSLTRQVLRGLRNSLSKDRQFIMALITWRKEDSEKEIADAAL